MNKGLIWQTIFYYFLLVEVSFAQPNMSVSEIREFDFRKLIRLVELELYFTNDFISNIGGIQSGPRNINGTDLYIHSDLSKYSRVRGELNFHFVHIDADDKRGKIGDSQIANSIDMPGKTDRLTDAWYQHEWSDNLKILGGIHDISTEFNITQSSLSFQNQSFGTTTDFAVSGTNGPSIYPITSLGIRANYTLKNDLNIRSGVYDADPGDISTYRKLSSKVGNNEGYLIMSEVARETTKQKIGLGNWTYTNAKKRLNC